MKKIDIYIIKKFLGTFFFAITLIIIIVIIFDVSEKIDDFFEKQAPLKDILFIYYLNFIPYFINLFSPLFTFIAVIFFTAKMASNTEIIGILSSGISFRRMLFPYFVSAMVLAIMSFYLANFLIPPANKKRIAFEKIYIKNSYQYHERNIHVQIAPGTYAYAESYNGDTHIGYNFTLQEIHNGKMCYKLSAGYVRFDTITGNWKLEKYFIRKVDDMKESIKTGAILDTVLNLKPVDLTKNIPNVATMNYFELREFIKQEKFKGSNAIVFHEIEKYKRFSDPFATLILTLIGISLSSRKVRGGIGFHLGAGLAISFTYILFMQISTTFSTNGNLHPSVSVWIPNIIFGLVGIYLLKTAPK